MAETGHNEQVQEPQGEQPAAETTPAPEDRVAQALDGFRSQMEERFGALEQRLTPAEPESEPEPEQPYLPEFTDDDYDPEGQLTPEAQQRALDELIDRRVQSKVEQALSPLQEQREEDRRMAEGAALEERYPELQDPAVVEPLVAKAIQWAEAMGNPELAREPRLFELVYMAEAGQAARRSETPAGTQGLPLERGGSAGPDPAPQEEDVAGRLVALAQKGRVNFGG